MQFKKTNNLELISKDKIEQWILTPFKQRKKRIFYEVRFGKDNSDHHKTAENRMPVARNFGKRIFWERKDQLAKCLLFFLINGAGIVASGRFGSIF